MTRCISVLIVAAAMLAGCDSGGGLLIRPVSTRQKLEETTVMKDEGVFLDDKVVIIDVDGLIMNRRKRGLFGGENPVSLFVEKLIKARKDDDVVGLILRINSPGGSVTASDIMYEQVLRFRRERPDVPVVALIEDVGASGGYYLACSAQEIVAHPTSVTGSIGVVVPAISFAGTMAKIGITAQAVTSGPFKDMASPLKALDPADLKILQGIVDEFHVRFVSVVDAGRPALTAEKIRAIADGRIYTGEQALANGLVDRLGQMEDVVDRIKILAGEDRVKVVMYHRPLGYRGSAYAESVPPTPQVNLVNISADNLLELTQPQFLYLWTGREAGGL